MLNVEFNSQYIPGKGLDRAKQMVLLTPLFRQKTDEHKNLDSRFDRACFVSLKKNNEITYNFIRVEDFFSNLLNLKTLFATYPP